jgi:large subunit ribosomal protein L5
MSENVNPRLQGKYKKEVVPALMKRFNYTNVMQVPRLKSIVLNMGLGEAVGNPKMVDAAVSELTQITGQKPVVTRAKKSIATFKLREGMPIGAKVTLRRERMWEFFDRLVTLGLPRVRDFRGTSAKAFDGAGNYTLGLKEQIVFPEIDFDKVEKIHGMDITIVTSTDRDDLAMALLRELGWPFRGETPQRVA